MDEDQPDGNQSNENDEGLNLIEKVQAIDMIKGSGDDDEDDEEEDDESLDANEDEDENEEPEDEQEVSNSPDASLHNSDRDDLDAYLTTD